MSVIDDVVEKMRQVFLDADVSESVVYDLKAVRCARSNAMSSSHYETRHCHTRTHTITYTRQRYPFPGGPRFSALFSALVSSSRAKQSLRHVSHQFQRRADPLRPA